MEGTNFIQLMSTYCFIPDYVNITCGTFAFIASYASMLCTSFPAKADCFHSDVLSASSASQQCNRSKNNVRKEGVFSLSYTIFF